MAKFDLENERVSIVDDSNCKLELTPQQALDLFRWLSHHGQTLYSLARTGETHGHAHEQVLDILLYQENVDKLDTLKAAIPNLYESVPVVVLRAPLDLVTERAVALLKELQIAYRIHPLLEEDEAFAQG